jgi:hypothetical protein
MRTLAVGAALIGIFFVLIIAWLVDLGQQLFDGCEFLEGLLDVAVDAGFVEGVIFDVALGAEFVAEGNGGAEVTVGIGPGFINFFFLSLHAEHVGVAAEVAGAFETPEVLREAAEEGEFEFAGVWAAADDVFEEVVEAAHGFAGDDDVFGGEAVFEGVDGADFLASSFSVGISAWIIGACLPGIRRREGDAVG